MKYLNIYSCVLDKCRHLTVVILLFKKFWIHIIFIYECKNGNKLIKSVSDFRIKKSPTNDQVPISMRTNIEMLLSQQNVKVRTDQLSGSELTNGRGPN